MGSAYPYTASREAEEPRGPATRIFLGALYLGWCVDALFFGKRVGISAPLFTIFLIVVLFIISRLEGKPVAWRNLWVHATLFFFATMLFLRANPFLAAVDGCACIVLAALAAHYHTGGHPSRSGPAGYLLIFASSLGNACLRPAPRVAPTARALRKFARGRSLPFIRPVLRGAVIAAPVLLVFGLLFASADLVFAGLVGQAASLVVFPDVSLLAGHTIFIALSAWLFAGGLLYATREPHERDAEPWEDAAQGGGAALLHLGFVEAVTLLSLVCALFLLFGWIQFEYLFGGQANISAAGFTYAEYARKGFFELVAVAVLTLGLMLALHYLVPRTSRAHTILFNALNTGLVLLVLVLLTSAFRRMQLYESAYGYTELRLYVYGCMIWLAALFGWQLIVVWLKPGRFAVGAFVLGLCFLAALNLLNPDAFITQQNFARYGTTGQVDLQYLAGLSDDAVPDLVGSLSSLDPVRRAILDEALSERLHVLADEVPNEEWPSYHLSHNAAYELLSANRARLR